MISALCTSRGPRPLDRGRYSRPAGGCPDPIEKVRRGRGPPPFGGLGKPLSWPQITTRVYPLSTPFFKFFSTFFRRGRKSLEYKGFSGVRPSAPVPITAAAPVPLRGRPAHSAGDRLPVDLAPLPALPALCPVWGPCVARSPVPVALPPAGRLRGPVSRLTPCPVLGGACTPSPPAVALGAFWGPFRRPAT